MNKAPKRLWITSLLAAAMLGLLAVPERSASQGAPGGYGSKFQFAYIPKNSRRPVSLFLGDTHTTQADGCLLIEGFTIHTFQYLSNRLTTNFTVSAPSCLLDNRKLIATSSGAVLAYATDGSISVSGSTGFEFRQKDSHFTISNRNTTILDRRLLGLPEEKSMKKITNIISALLISASVGLAAETNDQQRIIITSTDSFEFSLTNGTAIYTGNVKAIDPTMIMTCDKLSVKLLAKTKDEGKNDPTTIALMTGDYGEGIETIEAIGNVVIVNKTDGSKATGQKAVYTAETQIIALSGGRPTITAGSGYGLSLMSIPTTTDLTGTGKSLVIVALVDGVLHIRIFNSGGQVVVDKPEPELPSGQNLTYLTVLLKESPFPVTSELSAKIRSEIIEKATSISGHTPGRNGLKADRVIFDRRKGIFRAEGNIESFFLSEGNLFNSPTPGGRGRKSPES